MNARDAEGNTPLMSAANRGRSKMLETFLRDVERARQVSITIEVYIQQLIV
jgi:ankyrin repeat protein